MMQQPAWQPGPLPLAHSHLRAACCVRRVPAAGTQDDSAARSLPSKVPESEPQKQDGGAEAPPGTGGWF